MATRTKITTKTKRAVSGERSIALALVEILETWRDRDTADDTAMGAAINSAGQLLVGMGYAGLESISSRVSKIETAIAEAVAAGNGKEVSRLGAELERAKKGHPPIARKAKTEKPPAVLAAGQ